MGSEEFPENYIVPGGGGCSSCKLAGHPGSLLVVNASAIISASKFFPLKLK
ncbi:hypothetical protein J6590_032507 [Homalodisca vitripennis]|nr:hypothetical protein J6590_032507 [Homalodisca vitripennis]